MKVMVIGIDGATFDVLTPLINEGKLPHLEALIREGTSGNLKSTIPPLSSAAWSTFQTGMYPGKHGVFDFYRNNHSELTFDPANSTFLKAKTLWEILSDKGKKVGVINLLFTYPPREVNGFIITGKETPGEDKDYTFPSSLKKEILQFDPKYKVEPFSNISRDKNFLKAVPVRLMRQERVNQFLLKKYQVDCFMNLFAMPDIIHHIFWKHMDPSHPLYREKEARDYLPLIEKCFKTLDEIIGSRLKVIDEDTVTIIMSDHGAGPLHKHIHLNRWLQEQGLLVLKPGHGVKHSSLHRNLKSMMKSLYLHLLKYDSFGFRRKLIVKSYKKKMAFSRDWIDWSKTKAYAGRNGEHGIHCNLKGRQKYGCVTPGKEYEQTLDFIILELSKLIDPATGCKVFARVCKREDVYEGPYMSSAPDIMLDFGGSPYEPGEALLAQEIFEDVTRNSLSGMHRPDGILIVKGKGVKKGAKIVNANICDLAPTILYMMGVKIRADMDGKVLFDVFESSLIDKHEVEYDKSEVIKPKNDKIEMKYTEEETEEINKRLKSLGYL